MRLKIRYGTPPTPDRYGTITQTDYSLRFVFIVEDNSDIVMRDLLDLLSQRVNKELGFHEKHQDAVNIPFALLNGEYTINNDECVSQILENGDELILPDNKMVMEMENRLIDKKDIWLSVEQDDDRDSITKWARVGGHIRGKAFIQLGTGNRVRQLRVVSLSDVKSFLSSSESSRIIARTQDDTAKWFIAAQLSRVDQQQNKAAIMLFVKSSSKKQTWCEQVILEEDHGIKLVKGEVKHIAGNDAEETPDETIDYKEKITSQELKPKLSGKTDDIVDRSLGKTVTRHESEGNSDIDLTLSSVTDENLPHFVEANSFLDKNPDGTWDQTFTIPALTFVNKGSKNASVVSIRMQYQDEEGGEFKDAVQTLLGAPAGWGQYSWFKEGDTGLNLPPGMTESLVVRGVFRQKQGSPGSDNFTRRRAASHLPQPLKLRVMITDNNNQQQSLIVEQLNRPLGLPTAETQAKSWSVPNGALDGFVYIDDHDATERIYAALYKNKEGGEECAILRFSHGTYFMFNKKIIKKFEFQAQEEDRSELELSNQCHTDSYGREWKTTALFDKDNVYKMYGVRFRVATKDGSVEKTCIMPKLSELEK